MIAHPLVVAYRDNKARYDADYFLAFMGRTAANNPQLAELRSTPQYQALMALCTSQHPFADIVRHKPEFASDELEWLIENMPSGFHRSIVIDYACASAPSRVRR